MQQIKSKNRVVIIVVSVILFILVVGGLIVINRKNNLIGSIIQSITNTSNNTIEFSIDASQITGEIPDVFYSNMEISQWSEQFIKEIYHRKKFLSENNGKLYRTGLSIIIDSKNIPDYIGKLKLRDETILSYKKEGNVIFTLYAMPKWLSSQCNLNGADYICKPNWSIAPPKDYEEWAKLVAAIVSHYKNDLGINLLYEVWNEADQGYRSSNYDFWIGTEADYLKLYKFSVMGAKKADPDVKIGGPGSSVWNHGVIENFIKYARKENLQINFISWHNYVGWNQFLGTTDEYKEMTDNIKNWLLNNNYSVDTPLIIDEWNYFANFNKPLEHNTELTASYIPYALHNMYMGDIDGHTFFHLVNFPGQSCFNGELGSMCSEGIIQPVYNSFKALSILNGKQENQTSNQIQTNNVDDFLTIVSSQTQDKSKTRLLLSNFIPQGDIFNVYITNKFNNLPSMLSTKDYRDQIKVCIEENGTTQAQIETCVNNILTTITDPIIKARAQTQLELSICFKSSKDKIQCVNDAYAKTTDQQTKTDITAIKAEYEKVLQYQKESRQVAVNINNLPFSGSATITTHTIDKDHSNSCRYNKKTEVKKTDTECGINGNVDKWVVQAKTESKEKAKPIAVSYLKQLGYTNTQLTNFNNQVIDPCLEQAKPLVCAQTKLATLCQNNTSLNCDKITQDIKDAYKKYQEAYDGLFYYGKYENQTISMWIDKINTNPNISLEGSKQTKQITITNGKYGGMITMQPNSVVLVEIGK